MRKDESPQSDFGMLLFKDKSEIVDSSQNALIIFHSFMIHPIFMLLFIQLITIQEQLRWIENPTLWRKIELAKKQKLGRKEIKKKLRSTRPKLVDEITEETWSTGRMKREIAKGMKLMKGVKNKKEKVVAENVVILLIPMS